jgi:predicted neuraminidase
LLTLLFAAAAPCLAAAPAGELIFPTGSTAFPSSHASTIVELKDGSLLSAWFGGSGEGKPDVAIWSARHTTQGWSRPTELAREPNIACWNPVLFHTQDGRLWLYYKFGPSPAEWTAARRVSSDEGRTWSPVEHLPAGLIGPVRAKPLILPQGGPDGIIVSGSSIESYRSWAVWIERSTDNGATWTKTGPLVPAFPAGAQPPPANGFPNFGIIQPSIVALSPTHLRLYARSTEQIAHICISDSFDAGRTWSKPHPIDLPNPNSGLDAVALKNNHPENSRSESNRPESNRPESPRIVLIYNDTAHGRTPLNLALSTDGEHFRNFLTLESTPGEYSYPAIIQTRGGDLEITYTWNRKSIRHVHIPLSEIPH